LYKHAFKKSAKGYFLEYITWIIISVVSVVISMLINSVIIINIPIISFVVHAFVCVIVVCLATVVVFGKNKVFRDCLLYVINIVRKKKIVR